MIARLRPVGAELEAEIDQPLCRRLLFSQRWARFVGGVQSACGSKWRRVATTLGGSEAVNT